MTSAGTHFELFDQSGEGLNVVTHPENGCSGDTVIPVGKPSSKSLFANTLLTFDPSAEVENKCPA